MKTNQEEYHKKTMEYMFKNDPFFTTGLFLNELPPPFIGEEERPSDLCGERSCCIKSKFGIIGDKIAIPESDEAMVSRVGPTWALLRRHSFFSILEGISTNAVVKEDEFFSKMAGNDNILIMSPESFCEKQKKSPDLFSYDEEDGCFRVPYFNEVRVLVWDNPFSTILLKKKSFLYSESMTEAPFVHTQEGDKEKFMFYREYIIHPVGYTYGGPEKPLNEDLADQGNWRKLSRESNFVVMEE